MDFAAFSITFLTILFTGHTEIEGMLLTTSINPGGTLTINETRFNVTCSYQNQTGDQTIYALAINRKRPGETVFDAIITYSYPTQSVAYNKQDLESRTTAVKPTDSSLALVLMFNSPQCSDTAEYECSITYFDGAVRTKGSFSSINSLKSKTNFRVDGQVSFTPSTNIKEGDEVLFTCSGDVGSEPTGQLAWYMYSNGANSGGTDLSSQASAMAPVAVPNECTYSRTSKLNLTMTPDMNNMVIRCTGQQDVRNEFGDGGNNYKQTNEIQVLYAPRNLRITRNPSNNVYVEGLESLELNCLGDSNPNSSFKWFIQNENEPNVTRELAGALLNIMNLTLGDSGNYTCEAMNIVNQKNMTKTTHVEISVVEKPPPTTTTTTTPKPETEKPAAKVTDDEDDNSTTTIVIVVCVVAGVLVIVIVVVIICIKKRKGKKDHIEEPPEKPIRNNQDMSYFSNRPDLVSADQGMKNNALNSSFNNSFDSSSDIKPRNDDGLNYVDLAFDDKPRSRRPIQVLDNSNIPYADIAMPRV